MHLKMSCRGPRCSSVERHRSCEGGSAVRCGVQVGAKDHVKFQMSYATILKVTALYAFV